MGYFVAENDFAGEVTFNVANKWWRMISGEWTLILIEFPNIFNSLEISLKNKVSAILRAKYGLN